MDHFQSPQWPNLLGLGPGPLTRGDEGMKKGQKHRRQYNEAGTGWDCLHVTTATWNFSVFIMYSVGEGMRQSL